MRTLTMQDEIARAENEGLIKRSISPISKSLDERMPALLSAAKSHPFHAAALGGLALGFLFGVKVSEDRK